MTFLKVKINRDEINDIFNEVVDVCEEALRPAAQAGAQVLYDQVKRNVNRLEPHPYSGFGNNILKNAIYQVYSKDNSNQQKATYHISWNLRQGTQTMRAPHAHLIEFGHLQKYKAYMDEETGKWYTRKDQPLNPPRQIAAQPFMRPAMESHGGIAMDAMVDRYWEEFGKRYGA
jgi:hypothetical protein